MKVTNAWRVLVAITAISVPIAGASGQGCSFWCEWCNGWPVVQSWAQPSGNAVLGPFDCQWGSCGSCLQSAGTVAMNKALKAIDAAKNGGGVASLASVLAEHSDYVHLNLTRRSIQVMSCEKDFVAANLPLAKEMFDDVVSAVEEARTTWLLTRVGVATKVGATVSRRM